MVMFHGGPWSPMIYGMSYLGFYPELFHRFTLVWWDQYGCGTNYANDVPPTIDVHDFAAMAVDLVDALHRRYPDRAIILNGFSFGTYLTMHVADARPDVISAVINVAPIMNMRESIGNFTRSVENRLSSAQRRQLERLSEGTRYDPYLSRVESLAARFTHGFSYRAPIFNGMLLRWLLRWFTSREYGLSDVWGAAMGLLPPGRSPRFARLWDSMGQIDLWSIARSTKIPVLYIQGDSELYVLPDQLCRLAARRSSVHYVRISRSGHIPTRRAWKLMEQAMIDFGVDVTASGEDESR